MSNTTSGSPRKYSSPDEKDERAPEDLSDFVLARDAAVGAVIEDENELLNILFCALVALAVGVDERLFVAEEGRCACVLVRVVFVVVAADKTEEGAP